MRECGAAVLGVVLALVLVANGLTNDVVSNGRRLADGSKMVGAVVIPSVKISTSLTDAQRNCFIDSGHGDTASEALVDSGFLYARLGVSQCCRDHGNLVSSPGALYKFECTYTDGTGTHSSPYFIAQRLQVGTPCLVNCFAFGTKLSWLNQKSDLKCAQKNKKNSRRLRQVHRALQEDVRAALHRRRL